MIAKIALSVSVATLGVMLLLFWLGEDYLAITVVYLFVSFWGLEKLRAWYMGEDFGIAVNVKIPKNAHPAIRGLGASFALLVFIYGGYGFFQHIAT